MTLKSEGVNLRRGDEVRYVRSGDEEVDGVDAVVLDVEPVGGIIQVTIAVLGYDGGGHNDWRIRYVSLDEITRK